MQDLKDPQILQQQLNESRRKIDLIRSVTFELSKVLRLPEKLQNILVIFHEKFFINYSMILLPGDDGKSLRVQSSYGYEKDNLGFEVPAGTGIVGLAAVKKIPINITGIRRKKAYLSVDVNNRHQQPVAGPGLDDPESQIAIPLISNNELVAVLLAESYNLNVFSKEDESFLITLSQSIAVSIQNSMLFDNMEALIEKRTEELQRSNQTKDRLFAVISHDLRGPITSFHNVARLLSHYNKQHEAEKIDQLSQRIDLSVTRLNALLDNLLSWALTQTKELNAHLDRLNIAALLTEVAELFQDKLELKNIRLVT